MSKQITADRLRTALRRNQAQRSRKSSRDLDLIRQFAKHGLLFMVGEASACDRDRLKLELAYREMRQNPLALNQWLDGVFERMERYSQRSEWIYRIQTKYKVSGLALTKTTIGGQEVYHPWVDEDLRLIPEDLPVLRDWKRGILDLWIGVAQCHGLDFYEDVDARWQSIDYLEAVLASRDADWANAFEVIDYTSPSKMRSQGWDHVRSEPVEPDDEKRWEIHLTVGTGFDLDGDRWFCASNKVPSS